MRLSDQALGAIMLALQKSLMTQKDILPVLKGFHLQLNNKEEVVVLNPPVIDMELGEEEESTRETKATTGSD